MRVGVCVIGAAGRSAGAGRLCSDDVGGGVT